MTGLEMLAEEFGCASRLDLLNETIQFGRGGRIVLTVRQGTPYGEVRRRLMDLASASPAPHEPKLSHLEELARAWGHVVLHDPGRRVVRFLAPGGLHALEVPEDLPSAEIARLLAVSPESSHLPPEWAAYETYWRGLAGPS